MTKQPGLESFAADPANPNRMSDDDRGRMARALAEFGDLGGIVLNRRTGHLVGGHQRVSVMADGKLTVKDLAQQGNRRCH